MDLVTTYSNIMSSIVYCYTANRTCISCRRRIRSCNKNRSPRSSSLFIFFVFFSNQQITAIFATQSKEARLFLIKPILYHVSLISLCFHSVIYCKLLSCLQMITLIQLSLKTYCKSHRILIFHTLPIDCFYITQVRKIRAPFSLSISL